MASNFSEKSSWSTQLARRAAEETVAPRENTFIGGDAVIVAIHKKVN
jgi:hypothetical protein